MPIVWQGKAVMTKHMRFEDRLALIAGGPDECWVWRWASSGGYGQVTINGRRLLTHRAAYELLIGPIPAGLVIDHLCKNPGCVNPAHLEPVTQRENVLRGLSPSALCAVKTECPQGHPYDEKNTITRKGYRYCRTCQRAWQAEYARAPSVKARIAAYDQSPERKAHKAEYRKRPEVVARTAEYNRLYRAKMKAMSDSGS